MEKWQSDLRGMGSDTPVFYEVISATRPDTILEVGSWKGRSAIQMAQVVKALGLKTEIGCIDTWLGSPEFLRPGNRHCEAMNFVNGYPTLFYTFMKNVIESETDSVITPIPNTADNAALILGKLGVKADFIYIDAAHYYKAVLDDLTNYWELLSDRGIIAGDDFYLGSVAKAAREFARRHDLQLYVTDGKFVIARDENDIPENIRYEHKKDFRRAIKYVDKLLAACPHPSGLHRLGSYAAQSGDSETALECYAQAVAADRDRPDTWLEIGRLHKLRGDYARAVSAIETALEYDPDSPGYLDELATCHLLNEDIESARQTYLRSIAANSYRHQPHRALCSIYWLSGDFAQALDEIEQAIAISPIGEYLEKRKELLAQFDVTRQIATG